MKTLKTPYRLILSLALFLLAGVFLGGEYYTSLSNTDSKEPIMLTSDSIRAVGGIPMYAESATAIILGEVKTVATHPNNTNIPYTRSVLDATVEVNSILKGNSQMTEVTIKMIGGQSGMVTDEVDFVTLTPGEKVLLFLAVDADGDTVVFGDAYGKYLIDGQGVVSGPLLDAPITLADLKAQIQSVLE